MSFSEQEEYTIWIVAICCAGLSAVGSGIVCLIFMSFPVLRDYSFRLIFYLAIVDLILAVNFMIPESVVGSWCWLQGAFLNYAALFQTFLTAIIAYTIHSNYKYDTEALQSYEKVLICSMLFLSGVITSIPFITTSYGEAEGICWINASGSNVLLGSIYRLVAFYMPSWIVMFYCCVIYSIIILQLNNTIKAQRNQNRRVITMERRLFMYPLILVICNIPSSVNRILLFLNPDDLNIYLSCVALGLNSSVGFLNACAYGITPSVKYTIMAVLRPQKYYDSIVSMI